jgi:hypothetical protein
MKHIHDMVNSTVVGFSFDEKSGALEMELKDEIVATDFLQMKLAAIYVGSYCINHERADMDFAIKNFDDLQDVFAFLKTELIDHVAIATDEEIKNPEAYWLGFNPCFYNNNKSFKQRLAFVFHAPDLELEENESCYVKITFDIIESNYEFYE